MSSITTDPMNTSRATKKDNFVEIYKFLDDRKRQIMRLQNDPSAGPTQIKLANETMLQVNDELARLSKSGQSSQATKLATAWGNWIFDVGTHTRVNGGSVYNEHGILSGGFTLPKTRHATPEIMTSPDEVHPNRATDPRYDRRTLRQIQFQDLYEIQQNPTYLVEDWGFAQDQWNSIDRDQIFETNDDLAALDQFRDEYEFGDAFKVVQDDDMSRAIITLDESTSNLIDLCLSPDAESEFDAPSVIGDDENVSISRSESFDIDDRRQKHVEVSLYNKKTGAEIVLVIDLEKFRGGAKASAYISDIYVYSEKPIRTN